MHLLMKYEMENTAVNVIAQLTSQPEELIQSSLASSDMPSVLQAYGVDEAAFRAAMKEKILERVTESLSDGRITQEQADSIIDTINSQP